MGKQNRIYFAFRCDPVLATAIDSYGRENFPKDEGGYDRTSTLESLLSIALGIDGKQDVTQSVKQIELLIDEALEPIRGELDQLRKQIVLQSEHQGKQLVLQPVKPKKTIRKQDVKLPAGGGVFSHGALRDWIEIYTDRDPPSLRSIQRWAQGIEPSFQYAWIFDSWEYSPERSGWIKKT